MSIAGWMRHSRWAERRATAPVARRRRFGL
jgi:hypothetical protein